MDDTPAYGSTRQRSANVSYADVERAALDILATERRPSVETVREALGRGSPATIATCLKRFWRDLGIRASGDPAALTRLPSEIVEVVEAIWQRSLELAAQNAKHEDNAARERLEQIRIENEVRAQSFEMREKEFEISARERERALADSRDHLLSTLRMLESDRATLRAREARIAALQAQVEGYRRQLATVIERAVTRNRTLAARKPSQEVAMDNGIEVGALPRKHSELEMQILYQRGNSRHRAGIEGLPAPVQTHSRRTSTKSTRRPPIIDTRLTCELVSLDDNLSTACKERRHGTISSIAVSQSQRHRTGRATG
jgi:hypothetical protein